MIDLQDASVKEPVSMADWTQDVPVTSHTNTIWSLLHKLYLPPPSSSSLRPYLQKEVEGGGEKYQTKPNQEKLWDKIPFCGNELPLHFTSFAQIMSVLFLKLLKSTVFSRQVGTKCLLMSSAAFILHLFNFTD